MYYRDAPTSAIISTGVTFNTAFLDIVCVYSDIAAFTIRPVMIKSSTTSITELSSMWMISDDTKNVIRPYPSYENSFGPDISKIVGVYKVSNSNTIQLNSCDGDDNLGFSVRMSVFTYIVE